MKKYETARIQSLMRLIYVDRRFIVIVVWFEAKRNCRNNDAGNDDAIFNVSWNVDFG